MRSSGHQPGEPRGGKWIAGCRDHDVPEAPALEDLNLGKQGDVGEFAADGGGLAAGEGESRSICDVDQENAGVAEVARREAVELDAGYVRGSARAVEYVGDHEVGLTAQTRGQAFQHGAGVARACADRAAGSRTGGQRQVFTDESHQRGFEFDDLLP